ncbi:ElyC/SanA/YdcF family protein [Microlunatus panaciterrae]
MKLTLCAVLGLGSAGAAALVGSVAYIRSAAAGHLYDESDVPAAPVALVLGAKVHPDGNPSAFLAARLDLARRLYDAGKVEAILVSGDNLAPEYNEPDAMRRYLIEREVPADKVVADYAGFDTYDSCARAKRIFGVDRVIVVSQSYHVPRAVGTARRLGLSAVGVGDESARRFAKPWRNGMVRDQVACVKAVIDLVTRRDPVLGPREYGIDGALDAH